MPVRRPREGPPFAAALVRLRTDAGLGQYEAAEKTRGKLGYSQLSAFEAGRKLPSAAALSILCDAYGLDPERRVALESMRREAERAANPVNAVDPETVSELQKTPSPQPAEGVAADGAAGPVPTPVERGFPITSGAVVTSEEMRAADPLLYEAFELLRIRLTGLALEMRSARPARDGDPPGSMANPAASRPER